MAGNHCSHCPKSVRDWVVLLLIVAGLGVLGTAVWVSLGSSARAVAQMAGAGFAAIVFAVIACLVVSAVQDSRESKDTAPVAADPPIELEPEPAPLELEPAAEQVMEFPPLRLVGEGERVA